MKPRPQAQAMSVMCQGAQFLVYVKIVTFGVVYQLLTDIFAGHLYDQIHILPGVMRKVYKISWLASTVTALLGECQMTRMTGGSDVA